MSLAKRFMNKSVVVTGAASGIGLETAKKFASEGAKIALVDLSAEKLKAAEAEIRKYEPSAVVTAGCDVSKEEQVIEAVDKVIKTFGSIDVIVNNAGLMIFKPLEQHTTEDWLKILSVDLLGAFYFTKQAFLKMKNGGAIVNVSSVHAVETTPHVASYAAAKAAVVSLTRSSAIEGKPKGIRVNAILPGAVDTPMLWENPNIKAGLEVINQSDVGKPEDIADSIMYLASEEASFVQGTSLRVDGGRLARL